MSLKILISADMEGSRAAATPPDVIAGTFEYEQIRRSWTAEVNLVAISLFDAGATDVIVTDAHGTGHNLEVDALDPRASLIRGRSRRFGMMEGIDGGVDATVFLGYHAGAGSSGVLSHAYMAGGIHRLVVNGKPAGEGTLNAMLAEYFAVPVILVSGDESACQEAEGYAPAAQRVVVKDSLSRYCARARPKASVDDELAAAAHRAVDQLPSRPQGRVSHKHLVIEVEFNAEGCALAASAVPGTIRQGPRTVTYSNDDVAAWYRAIGAMWTLARAAQDPTYG